MTRSAPTFRISAGLADCERFPIKDLRRDPKNPRRGDMPAVRASIAKFGQVLPVLIASAPEGLWVVGGNTTMDAITSLGGDEIAGVLAPSGLSDPELRSLALALNRTSDLATYDSAVMAEHLLALHGEDIDLMHAAGFDDTALVDALLVAEAEGWDPPDEINVEGYTRRRAGTVSEDESEKGSDEYYTPAWIFDELGLEFDLDVSAPPGGPLHVPAKRFYTKADDGLTSPWDGRIWMNPPYSLCAAFVGKFLQHRNGVALLAAFKSQWFNDLIVLLPPALLFDGDRGIPYHTMLVALGSDSLAAIDGKSWGRVR